jgi:hypothetical protein
MRAKHLTFDPEHLWLECDTCGEEFDMIVERPEHIDHVIIESGHDGHKFSIGDYEKESYGDCKI